MVEYPIDMPSARVKGDLVGKERRGEEAVGGFLSRVERGSEREDD